MRENLFSHGVTLSFFEISSIGYFKWKKENKRSRDVPWKRMLCEMKSSKSPFGAKLCSKYKITETEYWTL